MKKRIINFLCWLIFVSVTVFNASASDVDISRYGAEGNGETLNTTAIQKAIDDCSSSGGGKVYFPAGKWRSGTLLLKNNVSLFLDENAVLLGSENIADYQIVDGFKDGTGQQMGYCFVGAVDVNNVGILGKGTVDGRGKMVLASGGRERRPFLVRFVRSSRIKVQGVSLKNSTAWTMHLFRCKDVKVEGLTILSRGLANNDGIDIDCCEDVSIKNCNIDTGDDAICFKTTGPYPCRNIRVSGMTMRTNCAAIKMGTESAGDFQNIKIVDINVLAVGLGAIKLLSVDGSNMKNVEISDIRGDKVNIPIMIRLGGRLKTFRTGDVKQPVGTIDQIKIKNVSIQNATTCGILISGIPSHLIRGVTLENIHINLEGGGTQDDAKIKFEEAISAYPEVRMFGKVFPSYGMYIRHAAGVNLKNIVLKIKKPDARPAVIAQDVDNLSLTKWNLPASVSKEPVIRLASVRNSRFNNLTLPAKPELFFNIEDAESRNIVIYKNVIFDDRNAIAISNGASLSGITIK